VTTKILVPALILLLAVSGLAGAQLPYPYPGPVVVVPPPGYFGHGAASVRTRVTPRETQVFVDGFAAGTADDFDGVFQRLQLVPGRHEISLYLAGYRTYTEDVYLVPNKTHDIRHAMVARGAGEPDTAPPEPFRGATSATGATGAAGLPAAARSAKAGALLLALQPPDATVLVDGAMLSPGRGSPPAERIAAQLAEGRHRLQVDKPGFEPFSVEIDIRGGETTSLRVVLLERR